MRTMVARLAIFITSEDIGPASDQAPAARKVSDHTSVAENCAKRLIDYTRCGGCAGKIPVQAVAQALANLPSFCDPDLLVGVDHFSDAGVYRLRDDLAIVNTVDFFPPMVDDPFTFGQIAATNALSDVYAMGAEPKTALNIVAFPDTEAPADVLHEILRGGADRVAQAGAVIVGGHSLRDDEIKYGLAVTGVVDPARMFTNGGAQSGDKLVLTKPLGTGFAASAYRAGQCPPGVLQTAIASMTRLNRDARDAALATSAHAVTDITGFGLAGHAREMAEASGITVVLDIRNLPMLPGTEDLSRAGHHSRATGSNRAFVEPVMRVQGQPDPVREAFLFDAQTSGGLLISVAPDRADELVERCHADGLTAATKIGSVEMKQDASLVIR